MAEPDELYSLRTYYWLGSYQSAINEANGLNRLKPALAEEKEDYVYRCYIGLGHYDIVISEIVEAKASPSKRCIKLLAQYLAQPGDRPNVIARLRSLLSDPAAASHKTVKLIAASIFLHDGNTNEAYGVLKEGSSMEQMALLVQMHVGIFRLDLAQKTLKSMKTIDEDSVLTLLATATVHIATGQGKAQEAAYIYDELIDKYGASTMLLNSLAVAKMHLSLFEEAETSLQEALIKSPSDADTLANLIVVSHHLHRSKEIVSRYTSQLRAKAPNHGLLVSIDQFEESFDKAAAKLS